jgi:hypothetical protein
MQFLSLGMLRKGKDKRPSRCLSKWNVLHSFDLSAEIDRFLYHLPSILLLSFQKDYPSYEREYLYLKLCMGIEGIRTELS